MVREDGYRVGGVSEGWVVSRASPYPSQLCNNSNAKLEAGGQN